MRTHWNKKEVDEGLLRSLYEGGARFPELAERFGLSRPTVRYKLLRMGVKLRDGKQEHANKTQAYWDAGRTPQHIKAPASDPRYFTEYKRAHLEISRRHRDRNRDNPEFKRRQVANALKYARANPQKVSAQRAARKAIKGGILERQPCEVCGVAQTQVHHPDYSKPLLVRWLCRTHHMQEHRRHP